MPRREPTLYEIRVRALADCYIVSGCDEEHVRHLADNIGADSGQVEEGIALGAEEVREYNTRPVGPKGYGP